jgi:hypothetical protein
MKCPACGREGTRVLDCIDSRTVNYNGIVARRRRYKCPCGERFTTIELPALCNGPHLTPILPAMKDINRILDEKIDNMILYLKKQKTNGGTK